MSTFKKLFIITNNLWTLSFKLRILTVIAGIILLTAGIFSCKKTDKKDIDPQSGKDYLLTESCFTDVYKWVTFAILQPKLSLNKSLNKYDTLCLHITVTPADTTYPKTITILFDSIPNCVFDGVARRGIITAKLSGHFKTIGTTVNISFKNFAINNNKIIGQELITNQGRNSQNQTVYTTDISNAIIILKDNNTIIYNNHNTFAWLNGDNNKGINSAIYSMTVSSNGTNINQKHFSVTTINPVTLDMGCAKRITGGKVDVKPETGEDMTVDFGTEASCTGKALLKIDNLADINLTFY